METCPWRGKEIRTNYMIRASTLSIIPRLYDQVSSILSGVLHRNRGVSIFIKWCLDTALIPVSTDPPSSNSRAKAMLTQPPAHERHGSAENKVPRDPVTHAWPADNCDSCCKWNHRTTRPLSTFSLQSKKKKKPAEVRNYSCTF